jgi:glycosyltransferase involved in cell wall biosynthesis
MCFRYTGCMRICFLTESFFGSAGAAMNGTEVQIRMIAEELGRRGHDVLVLAGSRRTIRAASRQEQGVLPVFSFRESRRLPWVSAISASRALRRLAPDVVYVRGRSYLAGVGAWTGHRGHTNLVWASNGEDGCERWKNMRSRWKSSRSLLRKLVNTPTDLAADVMCDIGIDHARAYVCQTQHQRDRLKAVHRREGVIIRSVHTPPETLPSKDTPPLVLWIGRVSSQRRPEAFVDLARELADVDCDFVLLGPSSSEYLERVVNSARDLPRFRYAGVVPFEQSWEWIARASVLVNTSSIEGVSNALVQAWHCGTPTVTLSLDPDGIIERNEVGLLSGTAPRLAGDVRRLLTDPHLRSEMGARARALAENEFSGRSVGAAYEVVLARATGHA